MKANGNWIICVRSNTNLVPRVQDSRPEWICACMIIWSPCTFYANVFSLADTGTCSRKIVPPCCLPPESAIHGDDLNEYVAGTRTIQWQTSPAINRWMFFLNVFALGLEAHRCGIMKSVAIERVLMNPFLDGRVISILPCLFVFPPMLSTGRSLSIENETIVPVPRGKAVARRFRGTAVMEWEKTQGVREAGAVTYCSKAAKATKRFLHAFGLLWKGKCTAHHVIWYGSISFPRQASFFSSFRRVIDLNLNVRERGASFSASFPSCSDRPPWHSNASSAWTDWNCRRKRFNILQVDRTWIDRTVDSRTLLQAIVRGWMAHVIEENRSLSL